MAEVVSYSTSLMTDADLRAMAVYLKDQPASPSPNIRTADAAAMRRGGAIYSDACASCHMIGGVGQPGYFAPLAGNAVAQQSNPDSVIHLILAGSRTAPTTSRPSPLTMPAFAWKLNDRQIADVATYVRNSWGNKAPQVNARAVTGMRKNLDLTKIRLTDNSGDHAQPSAKPAGSATPP
jgi:mono/diheme cytochrome c family protein